MRFSRGSFILLGGLILALGALMGIPACVEWVIGARSPEGFILGAFISLFIGGLMFFGAPGKGGRIEPRELFVVTILCWVLGALMGALPFYLGDAGLSFTDSFFESVSGLTTTGATILSAPEEAGAGILLWRAMLQWFGGLGVIAMAMAVLPFLRIGGMQIFQPTGAANRIERAMSHPAQFIIAICAIYSGLTLLCMCVYAVAGMGQAEAFIHALTTISTGGFSTHANSFGYYADQPLVLWAAILFMIIGALPFVLYVRLILRQDRTLFSASQVHAFLRLLLVSVLLMSLWLLMKTDMTLGQAATKAAFNVTSILSTTGFQAGTYTQWGGFALIVFFLLTYFGGCAGSTAGGAKIFRLEIAARALGVQVKRLLHPHAAMRLRYNNVPVERRVVHAVMSFLFIFVLANAVLTLLMAATGLDMLTAISAAATSLANVGPGLSGAIGPGGSYAALNIPAKWMMCLGMLAGRMELLIILVLFSPLFWKR